MAVPRQRRNVRPSSSSTSALGQLLATRLDYTDAAAARKLALTDAIARTTLPSAQAVLALHEHLLFLAAYPDDPRVKAAAERLLAGFARRPDLVRFRAALADTGIVGTAIHYPFFWPTALRLARRFPDRLSLDRTNLDVEEELRPLLAAALGPDEAVWMREREAPVRDLLRALAADGRSDAVALLDRLAAAPGDDFARERLHDGAAPRYRLAPGPGGPSRTLDRARPAARLASFAPPLRGRPDLAAELARPPRAVRAVAGREAAALVELARDAMVVRQRDLDCFAYGDPRDVRRVVHDGGLEMIAIGTRPERRLLLAAAYGVLTLRHGVPIGYVQLDGFLATALVHFNTFDTFRGADAAWVFARALATARALFGADAFAIEPYQLGRGNDEALDSGAFWFYAKLGFAPLDRRIAALARREQARFARDPRARSSRATLARLADGYLAWEPNGRAATVPPHAAISRAVTAALAARSEPLPEARAAMVAAASSRLGFDRARRLGAAGRLWLERWAPMLVALPGADRWPAAERRALGELVRLKAGRRESDLVRALRDHPRAGPALLELARRWGWERDLAGAPRV